MDIPAEVPEYLLRPLEVVHPSEAVAKRSDFHVSNEVQHELEEMCHTIRNEINDLDREITQRVAVLRDRYLRRNTRVSRFLEIRSTIASHKCLPTEILSQIFSLVCGGSRYAFTPPKKDFTEGCWVLGRVCARWRRVVLSTPKLWESVTIWTPDSIGSLGVDDENRLVAFYADVLSRGMRCLMVVLPQLAGSDFNRPLSHELGVRMLYQFASRLKFVSFACPISGFTQLLELSPVSFSLLTSAVIFVQPDSNYPADPIILPWVTLPSEFTLFKNSPHLTSLHFSGTVRPILPVVFGEPWSHLTVISFGGRLCTALGETQLLLSHCPRLKQCTLCLIHSENDPPHAILENRDQIILQDLLSLKS